MTEKQLDRVLDWVNRQRVKMGYKPIKTLEKGVPGLVGSCSLARSLSASDLVIDVDGVTVDVRRKSKETGSFYSYFYAPLPGYVREFARQFDKHRIPELVKE